MTCALRREKRDHHDDPREKKQRGRCRDCLLETRHREGRGRSAGSSRFKDVSAVKRRDRNTDEIHEVVSGKRESERESTGENDDPENVRLKEHHPKLQENRADDEDPKNELRAISVKKREHVRRHEGSALRSLHHEEVEDHRERKTAVDAAEFLEETVIAEGEDHAGDPLHDDASEERDNDRDENRGNHPERLRVTDISAEPKRGLAVLDQTVDRNAGRRAEELEHDRNRGRGREAHLIEDVQQQDVRHHYREVNGNYVREREHRGMENAAAGNFHHAARERRAKQHADRGNTEHHLKGRDAAADSGIQKVDGVVTDAHEKVHRGKNREEHKENKKECIHNGE
ncbi:unknown [Sutterella sp. CAG:351]|nr:unknown [Sutterella sp. CAG:351]